MDPNAVLDEIRDLTGQVANGVDVDVDRLVALVDGIDGWLAAGGFLPAAWATARP